MTIRSRCVVIVLASCLVLSASMAWSAEPPKAKVHCRVENLPLKDVDVVGLSWKDGPAVAIAANDSSDRTKWTVRRYDTTKGPTGSIEWTNCDRLYPPEILLGPEGKLVFRLMKTRPSLTADVWSFETKAKVASLEIPGTIRQAAPIGFVGTGEVLLGAFGTKQTTFGVFDLKTGKIVRFINTGVVEERSSPWALSADGKQLAVRLAQRHDQDERILLFDTTTCKQLASIPLPDTPSMTGRSVLSGDLGLAFSPDGKSLAAAYRVGATGKYRFIVWHTADGSVRTSQSLPLAISTPRSTASRLVCFLSDNRSVVLAGQSILDADTGLLLAVPRLSFQITRSLLACCRLAEGKVLLVSGAPRNLSLSRLSIGMDSLRKQVAAADKAPAPVRAPALPSGQWKTRPAAAPGPEAANAQIPTKASPAAPQTLLAKTLALGDDEVHEALFAC